MNTLKHYLQQHPAKSTFLLTSLSVALLFVAKIFAQQPTPLFDWLRLSILVAISAATVKLLIDFDWTKGAGLTNPMSLWHPKWLLASIPLSLIAILSMTTANFGNLELSTYRITAWLISNFATGFFEEVLMRGLCFFILIQAWGHNKKGVLLAALFQAAIFGIAHIGNLYNTPWLDVTAQIIFATLIGIGFAGLVYLTKSLWPAIIVHTLINSTGSINGYLVPGPMEFQSPGVAGYAVVIVVFFLLSTIPGLLYLKAGQVNLAKVSG